MSTNDQIILDEILSQRKVAIDPSAGEAEFFELFTAEQILKDYDLSYEQIESGIVSGGQDGGVDSIYLFANGELIEDEADVDHLKKNVALDLFLIQAKTTAGFSETPVERFCSLANDILDLSRSAESLDSIYNPMVIAAIKLFRGVYTRLAARFPHLRVSFKYASKGTIVPENVKRKVNLVRDIVARHIAAAEFVFDFVGSTDLLVLARRAPQTTHSLIINDSLTTASGDGFVCLVTIREFYKFITDDRGAILRNIFEANVRDYQGRTVVNDQIQKSLREAGDEDFWWLNNGVTVVASRASLTGRTLTIEDPQIVNGLQTSSEVYTYVKECNTDSDARQIMVRVIVPERDVSRDRIIKATNSQTPVQAASLRATDKIHRDIEAFLQPRGLYYDRRKNFHKNQGRPRTKIIGIAHLAQAVMSILLSEPNTARARPSSLLKNDTDYARVFDPDFPIHVFYVCAALQLYVESILKSPAANLDVRDWNNLKFYVTMHLVCMVTRAAHPSPDRVARIDPAAIGEGDVLFSLNVVRGVYARLGANDQVAKGPDMVLEVTDAIVQDLRGQGA